jgi:sulfatase maturation enzyme AslB (radical SAM superfamily)
MQGVLDQPRVQVSEKLRQQQQQQQQEEEEYRQPESAGYCPRGCRSAADASQTNGVKGMTNNNTLDLAPS